MEYVKKINSNKLYYEYIETPNSLMDYHNHILKLITNNLKYNSVSLNVSFNTYKPNCDLNIFANVEHLIRKNCDEYVEVLDECYHFKSFNKIIEYSNTNIFHNSK